MGKIRMLYLQLEPMHRLAGQLKKDKEQAQAKVANLHAEMNEMIDKIQVMNKIQSQDQKIRGLEDLRIRGLVDQRIGRLEDQKSRGLEE